MKSHRVKSNLFIGLLALSPHLTAATPRFDFPGHNLHNFAVTPEVFEHAAAMGYRFVVTEDGFTIPDNRAYADIGLIRKHNAEVSPIRIHERKSDGRLFVAYHLFAGTTPEGLNPIALAHGLRRPATGYGEPMPMEAGDLELLKGFGAARESIDGLAFETATYDDLLKRFHTRWALENDTYRSVNVVCNWSSRRVVEEMIAATLTNVKWTDYHGIFFDTLLGGPPQSANANYGGLGSYADGREGKLAFVKAIVDFVRDPVRTGVAHPYVVFTNIYDPLQTSPTKSWYASGRLRADHYYFEKGSKEPGRVHDHRDYVLGQQYANGVIPGTTQPAYVNRRPDGELIDDGAYIPTHRVALDDAHTWSRLGRREPNFDHAGFFAQHLDACGTAGIQGSWFGWYGEDGVANTDTTGRPIYDNACQLLRAIPNWDNMNQVPVPPYQDYHDTDARHWDRTAYRSPFSYASAAVIYSRHPDTGELFIVFRQPGAQVILQPGETIDRACFANAMFSRTEADALPALDFDPTTSTLTLNDPHRLGSGIRMKLRSR